MVTDNDKKYPEGHFVGIGIGIGMAMFSGVGVALSVALESPGLIGIGPALGVGAGVAIGKSIEEKKRKEGKIRPLTDNEKLNRKWLMIAGGGLLVVGFLVLLALYFTR